MVIVCLYSATLSISLNDDDVGICCNEQSWLIMFLKYMVTFYHVVPLSLYVRGLSGRTLPDECQ